MRSLEFRAYHKENGSYCYFTSKQLFENGFHVGQSYEAHNKDKLQRDRCGFYASREFFDSEASKIIFCLHAEWEQFTGLYDAKGAKIFEKDIVGQATYLEDDPCPFSVVFEDGSFRVKHPGWDETLMKPVFDSRYLSVMDYAVLGNIHENPELLESK